MPNPNYPHYEIDLASAAMDENLSPSTFRQGERPRRNGQPTGKILGPHAFIFSTRTGGRVQIDVAHHNDDLDPFPDLVVTITELS